MGEKQNSIIHQLYVVLYVPVKIIIKPKALYWSKKKITVGLKGARIEMASFHMIRSITSS